MKTFFKRLLGGRTRHIGDARPQENTETRNLFPLSELASRVGQPVEVHYLDFGLPQIEVARIGPLTDRNAFYLSCDGTEMHITYWHQTHSDGRVSGVKMIKSGDRVLYRNENMPFDYEHAMRCGVRTDAGGPARVMTREYLRGSFG